MVNESLLDDFDDDMLDDSNDVEIETDQYRRNNEKSNRKINENLYRGHISFNFDCSDGIAHKNISALDFHKALYDHMNEEAAHLFTDDIMPVFLIPGPKCFVWTGDPEDDSEDAMVVPGRDDDMLFGFYDEGRVCGAEYNIWFTGFRKIPYNRFHNVVLMLLNAILNTFRQFDAVDCWESYKFWYKNSYIQHNLHDGLPPEHMLADLYAVTVMKGKVDIFRKYDFLEDKSKDVSDYISGERYGMSKYKYDFCNSLKLSFIKLYRKSGLRINITAQWYVPLLRVGDDEVSYVVADASCDHDIDIKELKDLMYEYFIEPLPEFIRFHKPPVVFLRCDFKVLRQYDKKAHGAYYIGREDIRAKIGDDGTIRYFRPYSTNNDSRDFGYIVPLDKAGKSFSQVVYRHWKILKGINKGFNLYTQDKAIKYVTDELCKVKNQYT